MMVNKDMIHRVLTLNIPEKKTYLVSAKEEARSKDCMKPTS
jgi:hypothetical protein